MSNLEKSAKEKRALTGTESIETLDNWPSKSDLRSMIFQQKRDIVKVVPLNTDLVVITETGEMNPRIEFDVSDDYARIIGRYNMAIPRNYAMPIGMIPVFAIPWPIGDEVSERLERLKQDKLGELLQSETVLHDMKKEENADFTKKLQYIVNGIDWSWEKAVWPGLDRYSLKFASINAYYANVKVKGSNDHDFYGHTLDAMQAIVEEMGHKINLEPKEGVEILKVTKDTEHLFHVLMPHDERSKLWIDAHRKTE
ncbi:MAG: hypothetical protein ABSD68_02310 [Candidatus Micrarchaeales archaeon]